MSVCYNCRLQNNIGDNCCKVCGVILIFQCPKCTMYGCIEEDSSRVCEACDYHMEGCKCYECIAKQQFLCLFYSYADESKIEYTKEKLKQYLNEFFSLFLLSPRNFLRSFIRICKYIIPFEYKTDLTDDTKSDDSKLEYTTKIICPAVRTLLDGFYINMDEIEADVFQELTLNKQNKLNPIDEKTLDKLKLITKSEKKHNCFCGDDDNIKNIINIPCCNKAVHYQCIEKWFKIKNGCPYCMAVQK